jgi:hypothetical protein
MARQIRSDSEEDDNFYETAEEMEEKQVSQEEDGEEEEERGEEENEEMGEEGDEDEDEEDEDGNKVPRSRREAKSSVKRPLSKKIKSSHSNEYDKYVKLTPLTLILAACSVPLCHSHSS